MNTKTPHKKNHLTIALSTALLTLLTACGGDNQGNYAPAPAPKPAPTPDKPAPAPAPKPEELAPIPAPDKPKDQNISSESNTTHQASLGGDLAKKASVGTQHYIRHANSDYDKTANAQFNSTALVSNFDPIQNKELSNIVIARNTVGRDQDRIDVFVGTAEHKRSNKTSLQQFNTDDLDLKNIANNASFNNGLVTLLEAAKGIDLATVDKLNKENALYSKHSDKSDQHRATIAISNLGKEELQSDLIPKDEATAGKAAAEAEAEKATQADKVATAAANEAAADAVAKAEAAAKATANVQTVDQIVAAVKPAADKALDAVRAIIATGEAIVNNVNATALAQAALNIAADANSAASRAKDTVAAIGNNTDVAAIGNKIAEAVLESTLAVVNTAGAVLAVTTATGNTQKNDAIQKFNNFSTASNAALDIADNVQDKAKNDVKQAKTIADAQAALAAQAKTIADANAALAAAAKADADKDLAAAVELLSKLSTGTARIFGAKFEDEDQNSHNIRIYVGHDKANGVDDSNLPTIHSLDSLEKYTKPQTLKHVQFGRVTANLDDISKLKDATNTINGRKYFNLASDAEKYLNVGRNNAKAVNNYFYRGLNLTDLIKNPQTGKAHYEGQALMYGIDNSWRDPTTTGNSNAINGTTKVKDMLGNFVRADVDFDKKEVTGNVYNVWRMQAFNSPGNNEVKTQNVVDFQGKITGPNSIWGSATRSYDKTNPVIADFQGNFFGENADELGGSFNAVRRDAKGIAGYGDATWGGVFGAIRVDKPVAGESGFSTE